MINYEKLKELEVGSVNWEEKGYFGIERFKKYGDILYNLSLENEMQTLPLMKEIL